MAVLAAIGKVIGSIVVLLILIVVYLNWLEGQRNKDFAACNLSYLQTYPNGNTLDPKALEYLETCMAASGYKFDYRFCPDIDMRNVGSCYPTGFLPH